MNASYGTKTSSRIDPLAIRKDSALIYQTANLGWTLNEDEAAKDKKKKAILKGKDGKPSEANHGNIVPSLSDTNREGVPLAGGVTVKYAEQMTVISLPALRRLQFPIDGKVTREANAAGRTVVAALGLCGAVLAAERGLDLRSRCLLWPEETLQWELLQTPGSDPQAFTLDAETAIALLADAVKAAKAVGLPWMEKPLQLKPAAKLVELVRKSQQLAVQSGDDT